MGTRIRFLLLLPFLLHQINAGTLIKTIPFTSENATVWIELLNQLRKSEISSDMECVKWNENLAVRATSLAGQCINSTDLGLSGPVAGYNKLGQMLNAYELAEPADDVIPVWMLPDRVYCGATYSPTLACLNSRSVAYAQMNEFGCGAAQCSAIDSFKGGNTNAGFVYVCISGPGGDPAQAPFKTGTHCTACATPSKTFCCDNLCCDICGGSSISTSKPSVPTTAPPSTQTSPKLPTTSPSCTDQTSECTRFKQFCKTDPAIQLLCPATCGLCNTTTSPHTMTVPITSTAGPVPCEDTVTGCELRKCQWAPGKYLPKCKKTCNNCNGKQCYDTVSTTIQCSGLATKANCAIQSVVNYCYKSCGLC